MTINNGDRVRIHYTGSLKEGDRFDSSHDRGEPLEFTAGSPELIPGVSEAVVGMAVGEKKTVEVPPERGYGDHNDEMVLRVKQEQLPEGCEVGSVLALQTPDGEAQAVLSALEGDEAVLDGNHPLAGKHLVFEIEVVEIVQPS